MDINNLKAECNSLIDEVMRLQEIDRNCDLRIEELRVEIQRVSHKADTECGNEMDCCESMEASEDEMQGNSEGQEQLLLMSGKIEQPPEEENRQPEEQNQVQEEEEQQPKKQEPLPEEQESQPAEEEQQHKEQELPQEESAEKNDSELPVEQNMISLKEEARRLPAVQEEQLMQQVSLLAGGNGKEIVIVYETSDMAQKIKDVLKSVFLLIAMLLFIAAAALLIYHVFAEGVIKENVF